MKRLAIIPVKKPAQEGLPLVLTHVNASISITEQTNSVGPRRKQHDAVTGETARSDGIQINTKKGQIMNTRTTALLMAAALGLAAWSATAQDSNEREPRRPRSEFGQKPPGHPDRSVEGPRRGGPPILRVLDANHDGVIDATEMAAASERLRALDKDGDGKLTMAELHPAGGRGPGAPGVGNTDRVPPRRPPFVEALDANKDGVLDVTEISNAPAALAKLDSNGDGSLGMEELHPAGRGPGKPGGPNGSRGRGGRGFGPHRGGPDAGE